MMRRDHGQASLLLIGGPAAVLIGAFVFAAVGRGMTREGDLQRAADLAALAGARAMHDASTRLFEPVMLDHRPNPQHLDKDAYLALGREAAAATARANERVPVRRRAGRAVAPPSGPALGRAAGQVAATQRHGTRPRPARRPRLAGPLTPSVHFTQRYSWEPWHQETPLALNGGHREESRGQDRREHRNHRDASASATCGKALADGPQR